MDDNQIDKVQEGEIVSDPPKSAGGVIDLTGLINSDVAQIEHLKVEMGKYKEMLDSIFASDSTYQAHDTAVKEAVKVRSGTKRQILNQSQAADLQEKINENRTHIKELNNDLSDYLQEYAKSTGLTSIETEDGQVRQIVYSARLVKIGA
jgi:cell division septum initiation protein DivIVA